MEVNLKPVTATAAGIDTSSEEQYRILVDSITDYAIFLLDAEGHIITWNTGARQIKGYEEKEILGKHFSIFYTQKDIDTNHPEQELGKAIAEGKYEEEGWRVKKDGSVFWANVVITPVYDKDRQLVAFSKITRDLSVRKKAEDDLYRAFEELKESEERFRLLIEGVSDYAIFMLDPAGNVATWNNGARRMNGYEAHEIIGKYFSRFYSQELIAQGFPDYELQQAKALGRFEDNGWRYRKDGTVFWANTVITSIYNSKKELIGFSKITRDLTDKLKMEQQLFLTNEELRESEEKSRLMIDSVKDYAILMLNPEGIVMSWNEGAERIKGYKPKDIIGRHFSTFYTRESIASGFPQYELKKAQEMGRFEDEGWRIRKDGTAFWANVVITPIYNSKKRLLGFSKVTRDLTERRRNEELMHKNSELIKINNELDNFVYAASHDLKAPITNLEGLLQALREDLGDSIEQHEVLLSYMGSALGTLKNVIADLSDVTRLNHEQEPPEDVQIGDMLEDIKISLQPYIEHTGAVVECTDMEFNTLRYARKNLRSILFNLVSNAIKYADPDRNPVVSISTAITREGVYELSVKDNGLGLAPSQIGKIFSLFKRAHDHVEGTGIGLYLVKRILDNAGDSIAVESEVGVGSRFIVSFRQQ
ncbi:PAS domain-containing sensor histidine kinase [Pontibacter sp. HSC-36F09]|uniref:PAS domain-containing sensor histidine kinase n=1 Tax=Pontibacter sp. HSC-36F09 TaxID=2910966 RepID=UPI00209EC49D|nr:PAS domain-containing sensor histidine kinase [Pontibacter sp. HSC-36F09]MCP2045374.1 PAS domain S-box-containing protein [Pontibacter sp. HSC-36F09]